MRARYFEQNKHINVCRWRFSLSLSFVRLMMSINRRHRNICEIDKLVPAHRLCMFTNSV